MRDGVLGWWLTRFISFALVFLSDSSSWVFFFGPFAPAAAALCHLPSNRHHASLSSPSVYLFLWHLTDVWYHNRLPNPPRLLLLCTVCVSAHIKTGIFASAMHLYLYPGRSQMLSRLKWSDICIVTFWGFIFLVRSLCWQPAEPRGWSRKVSELSFGSFVCIWLRIICPVKQSRNNRANLELQTSLIDWLTSLTCQRALTLILKPSDRCRERTWLRSDVPWMQWQQKKN